LQSGLATVFWLIAAIAIAAAAISLLFPDLPTGSRPVPVASLEA